MELDTEARGSQWQQMEVDGSQWKSVEADRDGE